MWKDSQVGVAIVCYSFNVSLQDSKCYATNNKGYQRLLNIPENVIESHCDKLSYVTKERQIFPKCTGDCSCCWPSVTQGKLDNFPSYYSNAVQKLIWWMMTCLPWRFTFASGMIMVLWQDFKYKMHTRYFHSTLSLLSYFYYTFTKLQF